MRVLVIGRYGQLATSLAEKVTASSNMELVAIGRPGFDLEKTDSIGNQIEALRPDLVINAAAYTAVDRAETEPQRAFAINRDGAAEVARGAAKLGVPFVHISTDYVFDGRKTQPYTEIDDAAPLNVYGLSKLEGERAVIVAHPQALVLRTSWVFSPFGSNFLKTMLKVGAEQPTLRVVSDQIGNPTSALDLAEVILEISPELRGQSGGLYHLTGEGSTSWHDLAEYIFGESTKLGGPAAAVEAITSADYETAAMRPKNSRLDCGEFYARFGLKLRHWSEAAAETIVHCLSR